MTRVTLLGILVVLSSHLAFGQSGTVVPKGVPSPSAISPVPVRDPALIRLYNSVDVLAEGFAGKPSVQIRVVASWGASAELDCDCLLSRVRIAINIDGDDMLLYALPELLDPKVESIVTENERAVVYIAYGLRTSLRRVRIEVLPHGLRITDAARH